MALINVARGKTNCWNSGNWSTSAYSNWAYSRLTDGIKTTSPYIDGSTSTNGLPVKITLDLEGLFYVSQIKVWHYFGDGRRYYDAIVEVSPDNVNWTTLFDAKISGTYAETSSGKTHIFAPQLIRYVRDGIRGSNKNASNHWVELEVWADDSYVPPDAGERKVRFSQFI